MGIRRFLASEQGYSVLPFTIMAILGLEAVTVWLTWPMWTTWAALGLLFADMVLFHYSWGLVAARRRAERAARWAAEGDAVGAAGRDQAR